MTYSLVITAEPLSIISFYGLLEIAVTWSLRFFSNESMRFNWGPTPPTPLTLAILPTSVDKKTKIH